MTTDRTSAPPSALRVVVEQTAPRRLEMDANVAVVTEALRQAADEGTDLVVFPELCLTGYDLGRWAAELAVSDGAALPFTGPEGPVAVVGYPERDQDGRVFNVAAAWRGEQRLHRHRKRYLPTYGMFDEGRVFAPGDRGPRVFEVAPGWPTALLVCEELWHPSLPYLAALQGAAVLVVVAAGPGRGVLEGTSGAPFASTEAWSLLARTTALTHGVYVVLCNRAGVEGGVTFAGESLVVAPDGVVMTRASTGVDRLRVTLEADAVRRARTPYSHLRDEDPGLVAREIERILGTPVP